MPGASEQTCPNGCDLAEFGTHQGPPDCDLDPQDPGEADRERRRVELEGRLDGLLRPEVLLHARCGRPFAEHPYPSSPSIACPFPALPDRVIEFAPAEPTIRVCGIADPASIPPEVMRVLGDLAHACRDAYGMTVEVESPGEREAAQLAVETLRRYVS